jgi:hypothetical protein
MFFISTVTDRKMLIFIEVNYRLVVASASPIAKC